jgi:cellulose synthase/poly-beta-1,6-N-acetylglucosamine synthase-like glycosyltransferase
MRGRLGETWRHYASRIDGRVVVAAQRRAIKELRRDMRQRDAVVKELREELLRQRQILQLIYDDEPGNRRRLRELRRSPEYELAFTEEDPRVSIIIPTYTNFEALEARALPSVLSQTYPNIEVLVVGDCAPPETADVIQRFDDDRVIFHNRELRGPYPDDRRARRSVISGPPCNVAVEMLSGRWIAQFADDDVMRPAHVETLVRAAQAGRHEVAYGKRLCHEPGRAPEVRGAWPPRRSTVALQTSIYHTGLSEFILHELADALFEISSDKSIFRRMLRAGVRFGFVDEVVTDYYFDPVKAGRQKADGGVWDDDPSPPMENW